MWMQEKASVLGRQGRKSLKRRWHLNQDLKDEQGFLWKKQVR